MTLNDDGSGVIKYFGESMKIAWDGDGFTTVNDSADSFRWNKSGNELSFSRNGNKMVFKKR